MDAYRLRRARESYQDLDTNAVDTEVVNAQTATSVVIPAKLMTYSQGIVHTFVSPSLLMDPIYS